MNNDTTLHGNGAADEATIASMTTETAALSDTVSIAQAEAEAPKPVGWEDLGLHPDVKLALDEMGYFTPTTVQSTVYKPVAEGKDLLVQSKTGTGKTTAFGLPIISKIVPAARQPQAMILAPTRELALQVARELTKLAVHRGVIVEAVYGGAPIGKQITALRDGVHIIVGTPGRVLDHIGRRTLDCKNITTFVLDECDEMLSMGFLEDIERVVSHLPEKRQTLLFSATMPDEVTRYSRRHMKAPEQISLSRDSVSIDAIHHAYYIVSGLARGRDLLKIIFAENPESAIIFCNTRGETTSVAKFLQKQGLDAEPLSSDLSQADRERVMGRMKAHDLRFLCATDVAARGIDITNLSHVINYSVPESPEVYVHRTGRTGRAGKKGTALSLVGPRELGNFRYVRLQFNIKPEERVLPKDDIFEGKLKVPLPPVGAPQAPDPVSILIRGVTIAASGPTDLEKQILEKLLSNQKGKAVLTQLVADKLNQITTRSKPRAERPRRFEGSEAGAEGGDHRTAESFSERGERGDRPRFGEGGGGGGERGERPRFSEGGGDGPRRAYGDRFGGDRPRGEGGGDRGDRPRRFDGDRPRGEGAPEGGDRGDRPRRFDGDRPRGEGGDRGDRPRRFDGERGDRPRGGDRDRERGDRPRFGDRDRGPRDGETVAVAAQDATATPDAVIESTTTTTTTTSEPALETRPERNDRDRDRGDRGGRDRDRGGRDRGDRGGRDRDRGFRADGDRPQRDRQEHADGDRPRGEHAAAPAHANDATIEAPPVTAAAAPAPEAHAKAEPAAKGKRGKAGPTAETREFWETWAEEKSTRAADEPAPTAKAPAKADAAPAAAATDDTIEAAPAKSRERGGRGRSRDKRETKLELPEERAERNERAAKAAATEADKPRGKRDAAAEPAATNGRAARSSSAPAPAAEGAQARLFVNLGKKHGVSADDLRTLLAGPVGGDTARIGSVSLRDSHAHVRVPEELADAIIGGVHGTSHADQSVTVERSRA
jgi:ATP-dependent RNA helicase DeaD